MAAYSPTQLAALAMMPGVGLAPDRAVTAVAVAMAESGGNSAAMGDLGLEDATWGPSVGLWQIRSQKAQTNKWNPAKGIVRDASQLVAPQANAVAMAVVSNKGQSFGAWTTFTNGAYRQYLPQAQAAVAKVLQTPDWQNTLVPADGDPGQAVPGTGLPGVGDVANAVGGLVSAPVDALGSIASTLGSLTSAHTVTRGIQVVGGLAAIGLGVVLLNRDLIPQAAETVAAAAA